MQALILIGKLLSSIPTKEAKTTRLVAELTTLNLNLPARVWLPLNSCNPHLIVRIPPQVAAVLNSKDKVSVLKGFCQVLVVTLRTFKMAPLKRPKKRWCLM